jgi:hypothetical protein
MDAIYVQIPAYRDRELGKTLLDLYAKAANPRRLRTAVLWQRGPDERLDRRIAALPNLELIEVPHQQSRGCNWARNQLQQGWRGEPFTLLLDSHQRFVANWDDMVIAMYRGLRRRGVAKPMITGYLPAYDPEREPGARLKRPYKIYPMARDAGILTRLTSYPIPFWTSLRGPIPANFLSLHFAFVGGWFNEEVVFDPEVYFFGDEVLASARAFTSGYDMFHPHRILGWHCFNRRSRVPHWDDHAGWGDLQTRSMVRIRKVLTRSYRGRFGLGRERSLADYESHILTKLIEH